MSARYFIESRIEPEQTTATLSGPEAQHLLRVMRASVGDQITLFDGSGVEFTAEIVATDRHAADFTILQRQIVNRERPIPIVLAVSFPKGDRQRVLIEKAVEIGVHRLIPIRTAYSNDFYSAKSIERWERYVIEASKQCGRNRLMAIDEPQSLTDQLLPALNVPIQSDQPQSNRTSGWIAHPYAVPSASSSGPTAAKPTSPPTEHWIAIGPEGGFSPDEVELAQQLGWHRMELGPRILRVETAAIVAVSRFD